MDLARPTDSLIVGAGGLVGRHVLASLSHRSARATYHRDVVPNGEQLDITDAGAVAALVERISPRVIVLAAAEAWVERCEREPEATREINVRGTANLRRAANLCGALLVVFSSEYVFDGRAGPYAEEDGVAPLNEYGRQKVEIEKIARSGRHLVCRTSGVFGPEPRRKNFVLQTVDHLLEGREFAVPSDQVITPTYAPSLASALVELLDLGVQGTVHLCGPRVLRRTEFAALIARTFGLSTGGLVPRATSELDLLAPRPLNAGLSDGKLRRLLGHGLQEPEEALRELALHEEAARSG